MSGNSWDEQRYDRMASSIDEVPVLSCPRCGSGSDETFRRARVVGYWEDIICPACKQIFRVSHAVDEMFVRGTSWGYVYWLNCKHLTKYIQCDHGQATYLLFPNEFEEVYRAIPLFIGGYTAMAGGIVVEHTIPGMLVVAVAGPKDHLQPLDILVTLVGKSAETASLPPWKRLVLDARLAAFNVPSLTPIHAVSAIDLFVEELTGLEAASGRPASWSTAIQQSLGKTLREIVGKAPFQALERLIQIRNQLAHGSEYIDTLPTRVRAREENWRANPKQFGGEAAIPPSAELALRTALRVIRDCRREASRRNSEPDIFQSDRFHPQ